jgi:XTP/dITP diphosphohydrolase/ATP diphosphatase
MMSGSLGKEFERLAAIMARLRGPDGCPWDRKQTFDSIRAHTLEETYEVIEAIDERDWPALRDELGDLLLQVLFYARMAEEQSFFNLEQVVSGLANKLVRRHPHVFEDESGKRMDAEQALGRWNQMKAEEKGRSKSEDAAAPPDSQPNSLLGETPRGLPAMLEAYKISTRAAAAGFDWPDAAAVLDKLEEEISELRAELAQKAEASVGLNDSTGHARVEEEIGDMFFTVVNVARRLGLEPESALQRTNRKFRQRFARMEHKLRSRGQDVAGASMRELDAAWEEVKREESDASPRAGSSHSPLISNR